jgi:cyclopropane fatty-acyl-phospholipid synthase-like methyltransferase
VDYKKIVKQGYDQCAQNYLDKRNPFKNQKYLKDLVAKLSPKASVLDIGCGAGVPTDKFLIENGFSVTGIDISQEQIKLAQKNNPRGKFTIKDMSEIDYPDNSFDAIISFYAIFHIKREEHQDLFNKLFSILKPKGYLLVTMGSSEWEGMEEFHGVNMFWSHYGSEKSIGIIKKSGFKIIYSTIDTSGGEKHLIVFAQKA